MNDIPDEEPPLAAETATAQFASYCLWVRETTSGAWEWEVARWNREDADGPHPGGWSRLHKGFTPTEPEAHAEGTAALQRLAETQF